MAKENYKKNLPKNILSAWTAIEVLSPASFQKPEDCLRDTSSKIVLLNNDHLPWENNVKSNKDSRKIYYQIILGSVELPKAVSALLELYGDSRAEIPSSRGEAILATIIVDEQGYPVEADAVSISSFGWGLAKALKGQLDKLGQWTEFECVLVEELKTRILHVDEENNLCPLNSDTIKEVYEWFLDKIGLSDQFTKPPSFAIRHSRRADLTDFQETNIVNSFFLDDLDIAKKLFSSGAVPENLKRYLGQIGHDNRKDVLRDNDTIVDAVDLTKYPLGSWPGKGRHPLVLLQQCAVNLAVNDLKKDGIFAVNGPPGTGKTTLLRDVIAALVTKRATVLCSYQDPEKAFTNSGEKIKKSNVFIPLYHLDPKVKGFEMIVASSNNKAVENVSAELPAEQAVADDSELCYFKTAADALLARDSWGTIAAVLGNAKNRNEFRQKFWWDDDCGLQKYLQEASGHSQLIKEKTETGTNERKPHIVVNDNAPDSHEEALERWVIARKNFEKCVKAEQLALHDLQDIYHTFQSIKQQQEEANNIACEIAEMKLRLTKLDDELEIASATQNTQRQKVQNAKRACEILWAQRPNFLRRLLGKKAYLLWKNAYDPKLNEFFEAERVFKRLAKDIQFKQSKYQKITSDLEEKQSLSGAIISEIEVKQRIWDKQKNKYPDVIFPDSFSAKISAEMQTCAPWLDKVTARLRNDVFEAAIAVHKAFIDCAAKPIRHNLNVLMDGFGMRSFATEEQDELIPDLWSTLFLIVPVISTTFASVSRMFRKIGPETFGWLLIDEAGQALPQAAIGALMRTKRAIVVGDPMQIEPVVVLPEKLTEAICQEFDVDPLIYNAPRASVQTLADSATKYYATFETALGDRQVGMPLLVHRRCAEPMFSISNSIAYGNMMVQAKFPKQSKIESVLGPSQWFDVKGVSQEKWCPEEGEEVINLLRRLKDNNVEPDLYIVTPFVLVQNQMRKMLIENGILLGWVSDPKKWANQHVGTVHTVQGREAEAVFFILGAANSEQSGARNWAGKTPNLLNVAVTRAKEVLYVIGNRDLWKSAGVFRALDKELL